MAGQPINVVFIASGLAGADEIDFDAEFANIQRILDRTGKADRIRVRFYKNVTSDTLWDVLKPPMDILQISAHGNPAGLAIFDAFDGGLKLTGNTLAEMLIGGRIEPSLIILNACESSDIAQALLKASPFVIGTTHEITDRAAIMIGGVFFERLTEGASLAEAHTAASAMLNFIDQERCRLILHNAPGHSPLSTTFVESFRIVAAIPDLDDALDQKRRIPPEIVDGGEIELLFGVAGASSDVTQLVLYTDDASFLDGYPPAASREQLMSWIEVGRPNQDNEIWIDDQDPAHLVGDCRWFASAPTVRGTVQTASSTVIEALKRYYFTEEWKGKLPDAYERRIWKAIEHLRANNGGRKRRSGRR